MRSVSCAEGVCRMTVEERRAMFVAGRQRTAVGSLIPITMGAKPLGQRSQAPARMGWMVSELGELR